ncbi:ABC transporter substrate-binding protein [Myceligenerans xiligouense]|uniref:Carbohydrate ABC transporter substrate-binding protein (CUT1 family) n=1 Tax=Myceligenerans xiligouense TaxID=253184 RepID=A0A3N4YVR8_9MICO|nr:extracellular solute-binding protein [Myceligenerans xiligouense]RPF22720.1 carbohydrate ABC transporter substrate-binding protein (CUT1 family) [Myceligenerans xiligouense]
MKNHTMRRALAAGAGLALAGTLAACGGSEAGGGGGDGASADEIEAALQEGGELTYWTWTPQAEKQVEAFEAAYPNVEVNLVDTSGAADNNQALQNAIAAGDGVPDVVQIEYQSLLQFQLPGHLTDLTEFGFGELEDLYTPSTWGAVSQNDGIWGLPQDSGPMAFFYNEALFAEHGVDVPTTWDEYIEAGEALQKADPDVCIGNDTGDAGLATSLIWQAGGQPFRAEGEQVTIDLADEGTTRWADMYQRVLDAGILCDIPGWTDEWFAALNDGTIASITFGAWGPGILEGSVPDGAGDWRIAPMLSYDGTPVNAENGGSSEAVPADAPNKLLGAGFLKWLNTSDESIDEFMATGGFPATVKQLESEEFLGYESEYFGGQAINEVLVGGADSVVEGWQYLPWQSYANGIFADTVGQAWLGETTLTDGLAAWQAENVKYGTDQGFTVTE